MRRVPLVLSGFREAELEDLRETCGYVRAGHVKHRAPKWMIVAVGQVDLYQDAINAARDYYAPDSHSSFADVIKELTAQVGALFFRWNYTLPISTFPDPFEWNGETIKPSIGREASDAYIAQFAEVLKSYCR